MSPARISDGTGINRAGPYHERITAAHDFELPPHTAVPTKAVDADEHGQVVY